MAPIEALTPLPIKLPSSRHMPHLVALNRATGNVKYGVDRIRRRGKVSSTLAGLTEYAPKERKPERNSAAAITAQT
ncbi:hypothetical protein A9Q89_06935 [Gammaproteobacteria bacterium 53_120_T64]|nr:hypothetical protein A9Q89_06935 [Gammaproteobacteria bacterium 53_120_T64]